jgi:hypothetical protein
VSRKKAFQDTHTEGPRTYTRGVAFPPGAPGFHDGPSYQRAVANGHKVAREKKAVRKVAADIWQELLPSQKNEQT